MNCKDEWSEKTLYDLGTISRGKSKHRPRNDAILYNGQYPFIQTADVKSSNLYINTFSQTYNDIGLAQSKLWDKGTLCITIAANIADASILDFDACFPDSILGFTPRESISDVRFIKYCFDLLQADIKKQSKGSTQDNLSLDKLSQIKFNVPSFPTQKKIADVLSCIDDKIALNNKTNTELENIAKTIYDYWFTQFDFPDKNGHPYKTSGGQMVYNETLKREIPAGWEVKNILDCCKVIDCLHSKKPDYCYEEENFYLLQLENLIDLKLIDLTNKYYVSKKDYEIWTSKTKVKQGDLVVTNAGRVGGVSRIPNYIETGIGRNMTSIRPISISEYLLCYFFSSSDCNKQIRQNTDQGAFFKSLNVKGIKKLNLTIPPKEIQDKFDSLVGKIRLQIESNHQESEELTKLRDYLLPLLMNGQVEVK